MKLVILQIKNIRDCEYAFRSHDKNKFKLEDYRVEFCGNAENLGKTDEELLEIIFRYFNVVTEEDVRRLREIGFTGHSLSTSDVVSLDGREYYCEHIGWKRIN